MGSTLVRPGFLCGIVAILTLTAHAHPADDLRGWLTTEDLSQRLTPQPIIPWVDSRPDTPLPVVQIDPETRFQTILGLGSSLEPTTCSNLFRLPLAERERVVARLVRPDIGIGMNLMRICIGTPDFTGDPWYSYCDLPRGESDPSLARFSIERDKAYILPVLRLARHLNPNLRFFASPWSPPGWMKSSGSMIGGHLLPQWYAAYAQYFVRFLQSYDAEGIPIHAITVQNEPGVDRSKEKDPKWHYPSCHWTAEQERDFIRDHLGPALRSAGLKTLIWCYDHNYNLEAKDDDPGIGYPRTILSDSRAAAFVGGVGFHGYVGDPSGMSRFREEFPNTPIYFTEGSVFAIWGAHDIMERLRHGASSYNAWVSMLDEKGRPNNGPFPATHAILKLHSDTLRVEELFEFHAYGQFMKFIQSGAVRIQSSPGTKDFNNIAVRNPDGSVVVVVVNTTGQPRPFALAAEGRHALVDLPPKSVLTLRYPRTP